MSNKVLAIIIAVLVFVAVVPGVLGVGTFLYFRTSINDAQAKVRQSERAKMHKDSAFDGCLYYTRSMARDVLRGNHDIRVGAAYWNGDERVIVVSGFARTPNGDQPINAEFSKCVSGYTCAAYTIGHETRVVDDIEYKRIQELMRLK